MTDKPRLVVLISGNGSNLQALLDAIQAQTLHAEIVLVLSNRKSAYGLERARIAGINVHYQPLKPYRDAGQSREQYDSDLAEVVKRVKPDLIVLAGWMHVLSSAFLDQFPNRVINLHPALPGQFAGTDAINRAYNAYLQGEITRTGCMVHYVVPEVDAGPVIATSELAFSPDDTLEAVEERMHKAEHDLIVRAVNLVLKRADSDTD